MIILIMLQHVKNQIFPGPKHIYDKCRHDPKPNLDHGLDQVVNEITLRNIYSYISVGRAGES